MFEHRESLRCLEQRLPDFVFLAFSSSRGVIAGRRQSRGVSANPSLFASSIARRQREPAPVDLRPALLMPHLGSIEGIQTPLKYEVMPKKLYVVLLFHATLTSDVTNLDNV